MYIGIDIGATNIRVVSVKTLLDTTLKRGALRFQMTHHFESDFENILKAIQKISSEGSVDAIGIGTPGVYDRKNRYIVSAKLLREWERKPFVNELARVFSCPVFADNDAVVGSLGEAYYGTGLGKSFLYFTWGTGVGGAQVTARYSGAQSLKIPWKTYLQEVNELCGGHFLALRFGKNADQLSESEWKCVMFDLERCLTEISQKLAQSSIIIGGGVSERQRPRIESVVESIKKRSIYLTISHLADDIGLIGAFALIRQKLNG